VSPNSVARDAERFDAILKRTKPFARHLAWEFRLAKRQHGVGLADITANKQSHKR
jgi:hypothetical protein